MLRPWFELVRLPAVFTAPSDVLAGTALAAAAGASVGLAPAALLFLTSALIYCAGMAANDLCDAAVDAHERPGRPIPSGRVSRGGVWALVLALQATGIGLALLVGRDAGLVAAGVVAATWLYNAGLKNTVLGPPTMGLCRYGNAILGLAVAGLPPLGWLWAVPATTLLYVTALTFTSRREVAGTTAADLRPSALALFVLAAAPAVWACWMPAPWAAVGILLPLAWLAGPLRRALATPSPGPVRGLVMAGIYGIAMVNGVLAAMAGGYVQAAIAVGLLVPGRFFGRWFYAT